MMYLWGKKILGKHSIPKMLYLGCGIEAILMFFLIYLKHFICVLYKTCFFFMIRKNYVKKIKANLFNKVDRIQSTGMVK